jgi:hypothetical protein
MDDDDQKAASGRWDRRERWRVFRILIWAAVVGAVCGLLLGLLVDHVLDHDATATFSVVRCSPPFGAVAGVLAVVGFRFITGAR